MDLLVFALLNLSMLVLGYIILSRRIDKHYGSATFLDRVAREVNSVITELNETTERNIRILEATIDELKVEKEQAELLAGQLATLMAAQPIASPQLIAPVIVPAGVAPVVLPVEKPIAPPFAPQEPAVPEELADDNPYAKIVRLHRQGFAPEVIASRIGRTVGEVETVIGMNGKL